MSDFAIETGIPVPPRNSPGTGRPPLEYGSRYPFATLKVGESFFLAGRNSRVFSAYTRTWAMRNGSLRKFRCRDVEGGVRVWRVE